LDHSGPVTSGPVFPTKHPGEENMGIDAVVIGAIASVVVAIVIIGIIGYRIIKSMDDKSSD
jgi:hypothetical protein